MVSKIPELPDSVRQAARLKRAWHAVRAAAAEAVEVKKKGAVAVDLDELLPEADLRDIAKSFWARYRTTFPPTIEPSDLVVSRLGREIKKRLISVRDIAWVKTMAHQLTTSSKRLKISDMAHMYMEQGPQEDSGPPRDATAYIESLRTLAIAYAKAGVGRLPTAPSEEPFGADQNLYVEVPLDTVMRYVYRAERQAQRIPYTLRYEWLKRRDEEERMRWVDVYRNSSMTLGAAITLVYTQRETAWEPPEAGAASSSQIPRALAPGAQRPPKDDFDYGKVGSWASALRSGQKICQAFQRGQCKNKQCPEKHGCAVIIKRNRVCLGAHPASKHKFQ